MVQRKLPRKKFRVGEVISISGIYRVFHSIHRISHDVTVLKGETFPPCSQCGHKVYFQLVRAVPEIDDDYGFKVRLFQIPHPGENQAEVEETA